MTLCAPPVDVETPTCGARLVDHEDWDRFIAA
jgi:hypothetical protein